MGNWSDGKSPSLSRTKRVRSHDFKLQDFFGRFFVWNQAMVDGFGGPQWTVEAGEAPGEFSGFQRWMTPEANSIHHHPSPFLATITLWYTVT